MTVCGDRFSRTRDDSLAWRRLARYLGEGKPESAKRILKLGSATLLLGGVVVCLVLGVAHNKVWQIWSSDPELIALCNSTLVAFMASVMTCYCRFLLAVVSVSLGPKEVRLCALEVPCSRC